MTLFGTLSGRRSAAAELARLLDSAVDGPRLTPAGPAGSTAALAGLALRLQAAAPALAATAVPREDFRAALRTRLVAVASVQGIGATAVATPSPVRAAGLEAAVSWSRARRGAGIAVGAMASVVVVAGVGVAGQQSLPGEPFYGVKRAVEGAALRTADGALERGTTHLAHADERLDEVAALARGREAVALAPVGLAPVGTRPVASAGTADLVLETLDDRDASVRAAARLLTRASDAGSDPAPLQQLTGFAVRQDRELSALLPVLPLVAQERAQASLALTDEVSDSAVALLLDGLPVPGAAPAPLEEAVGTSPADPTRGSDPASPGAPLAPAAPGTTPASPGAPGAGPAPGSTDGPDDEAPTTPGAEQPAPGAQPQASATSRPTSRPEVPVPAPVQTVPVPLPVPVPTSIPLPVPVPDLPDLPAAPLPPVVVEAPALPSLPKAPALPAVEDVVPAPLSPVTKPLPKPLPKPVLPGLLVGLSLPSPVPGAAPSAPAGG